MEVEHTILPRNCRITLCIDDRELHGEVFDRVIGASQIVGAKGDDFGIGTYDALVILCQLDELAAAERSPERTVEDQHGIFIAADLR